VEKRLNSSNVDVEPVAPSSFVVSIGRGGRIALTSKPKCRCSEARASTSTGITGADCSDNAAALETLYSIKRVMEYAIPRLLSLFFLFHFLVHGKIRWFFWKFGAPRES
jgi:hypothetical protein